MTQLFTKNGVVREADSKADEVRFAFEGWRPYVADETSEAVEVPQVSEREALEQQALAVATANDDDSLDLENESDDDLRAYIETFRDES